MAKIGMTRGSAKAGSPLLIRVNKCSISRAWYEDKVPFETRVVREDAEYYWCREDGGYINIINKQDAEQISMG